MTVGELKKFLEENDVPDDYVVCVSGEYNVELLVTSYEEVQINVLD